MTAHSRRLLISLSLLIIFASLVMIDIALLGEDLSDITIQRELKGYWPLCDCPQCTDRKTAGQEQGQRKSGAAVGNHPAEKDIEIIVTYSDVSGAFRIKGVKSSNLSASWIWKNPDDEKQDLAKGSEPLEDPFQPAMISNNIDEHSAGGEMPHQQMSPMDPAKLNRQELRQKRRSRRTGELINQDKEMDNQMQASAIKRAKQLDTTDKGKYSIWRKEDGKTDSDSILKLMRDQIIMAKAYASIAKAKNESGLFDSLIKHSRKCERAIGEAISDAELLPSVLDRAKEMGRTLSLAKDELYDCYILSRKLRTMLQSSELSINELKKKSAFLTHLASKTVPKPLHCLPLVLTTDYFLQGYKNEGLPDNKRLEDPSLYHYAIFSDNVLATSVVVNSTVLNAKEPEKHVIHIVTDRANFAAMKMWFLVNSPAIAAIQVENVDDFTWLNSSYCPILRQLESSRMKEYYLKTHQASSLTAALDNFNYRNPKYLSMMNHLRFYLPEVYPKLDKILFLDDDIVVQKDLTPLWSFNLQGMVNGAVETCKGSFHRFDKYLNFSNPKISQNFDPKSCGWAYGMNIFDLKEWRKRNITGLYHLWQDMNAERTLWKLGTLPAGLVTFYNLTYPLDQSWHVLKLGYDMGINQTEIKDAAVIHYNGNYKPWLDIAIGKYKSYWSRYVMFDNPYLQLCNLIE